MSLVEKIYQDIHEIKEEKGQKRDLTLTFPTKRGHMYSQTLN